MSSANVYNLITAADSELLKGLLQSEDYKSVRKFLENVPNEDVEALIREEKTRNTQPATGPAPLNIPSPPAGAGEIQAMVSPPGSSFVSIAPVESDKHAPKVPDPTIDVSEQELRSMWDMVDNADVTMISPDVIEAFKYQGFNPDAVLKSLMKSKKSAKISNPDFLKDITTLCALAVIKGSITDKNIKKMSDKGKSQYDLLEKRYNIVRGGGKGKPAEVVTVARIAAAFPGKVVQLLQTKQVPGRDFIGEFHTHKLPGVLKHQALAACIPKDFAERSKDFLLDLITVFSVDQTRTISRTKEGSAELIERQKQFTNVSHGGAYPPENQRKMIIKIFQWNEIFPLITPVATHVKGKWNDFHLVTQQEFLEDIKRLN